MAVYNYGAAPTYVKLASQTLTSIATSVTFSNIAQGYTDLVLIGSSIANTGADNVKIYFNGDTAANYSTTMMSSNGSTANSGRWSNEGSIRTDSLGYSPTGSPALKTINIQNYSNSTTFKTVLMKSSSSNGLDAPVGLWRSTAPITSLTLTWSLNFQVGSTFTLYGVKASLVPKATGGDLIRTDGTYWYHIFNNSGLFSPRQTISTDILTVAGGGAGGSRAGGGGGAGGLVYTASQSLVTSSTYTVTVGAGGPRVISMPSTRGNSGSNTTVTGGSLSLTAAVGGGGGGVYPGTAGLTATTGGSGGGGGSILGSTSGAGAAGTAGQGFAGGNGASNAYHGGGGGGAGAAGSNGDAGQGGNGGIGSSTYSSWGIGQNVSGTYYLAGGGGGSGGTSSGGSGGGGAGSQTNSSATSATANTGGGGGAARNESDVQNVASGSGGSGIVVMRYAV